MDFRSPHSKSLKSKRQERKELQRELWPSAEEFPGTVCRIMICTCEVVLCEAMERIPKKQLAEQFLESRQSWTSL